MTEEGKHPKAGVAVLVRKEGKILLAKRKNTFGKGMYCGPGGHLEYWESFEECVRREVREEAGVEIKDIKFLRLWNFKTDYGHYVDVGFAAEWVSGEPQTLEPDKFEDWHWYDMDHLPSPLLQGEELQLDALKTGRTFYDA